MVILIIFPVILQTISMNNIGLQTNGNQLMIVTACRWTKDLCTQPSTQ